MYAPDYVVNAGGVIDVAHEGAAYDPAEVLAECERIYDVVLGILEEADRKDTSPLTIADALAESGLRKGRAD